MTKIIAIVGMPGSGKTEAAEYFAKKGFQFIRLGQLTMDEIKKRGLEPTEKNEKMIRESLRKQHGMAAYALLNFPKIDTLLKKGNVIVDGLYSWEEYLEFKKKYPDVAVIAIYASPKARYARLEGRKLESEDKDMKNRQLEKEAASERDTAEIENLNKGGPIAVADFTVVNEGALNEMHKKLDEISKKIK